MVEIVKEFLIIIESSLTSGPENIHHRRLWLCFGIIWLDQPSFTLFPRPPLQFLSVSPTSPWDENPVCTKELNERLRQCRFFFFWFLDVEWWIFWVLFLWERRMLTKLRSNSEVSLILIWERSSYRSWDTRCLIWWLFALYHRTWENSQQSRQKINNHGFNNLRGEGNVIFFCSTIACFWHVHFIQQPRCKMAFQAIYSMNMYIWTRLFIFYLFRPIYNMHMKTMQTSCGCKKRGNFGFSSHLQPRPW